MDFSPNSWRKWTCFYSSSLWLLSSWSIGSLWENKCYILSVRVPTKSTCWSPDLQCDSRINTLIRKKHDTEYLSLGHVRKQQEQGRLQSRKWAPTMCTSSLILPFPASITVRSKCWLSHPFCGICCYSLKWLSQWATTRYILTKWERSNKAKKPVAQGGCC